MGEPIPPIPPSPGICLDCCANLPNSFGMSIIVPELCTYFGVVVKVDDCIWSGPLYGPPPIGETSGDVFFCWQGSDDLVLRSSEEVVARCGSGWIVDNHCDTPVTVVTPTGCTYSIW